MIGCVFHEAIIPDDVLWNGQTIETFWSRVCDKLADIRSTLLGSQQFWEGVVVKHSIRELGPLARQSQVTPHTCPVSELAACFVMYGPESRLKMIQFEV